MLVGIRLQALWRLIGRTMSEGVPIFFSKKMRRTSFAEMDHFSSCEKNKDPHSPLFVGMIHGLARSALLLALIPLTNQESPWLGLAY